MDLAEWTMEQVMKNGSLGRFAAKIGLSRQSLMDWRDGNAGFITDKGARAIARYLEISKTPEEVREMFGMPIHPYLTIGIYADKNKLDKPEQNDDDLQARIVRLEEENRFFREQFDDVRRLIDTLAQEIHEQSKSRTSKSKTKDPKNLNVPV
jgi:transcriptional regulator with XRE-family HTH domain